MIWEFELGYVGLFFTSFLAATFLPIASEVFLASMLLLGFSPIYSLLVATFGNTLGSYLNYGIGYLGDPKWFKYFGVKQEKILIWEERVQKYGIWLALLSWLPFIGDVLSTALGFFKVRLSISFLFIFIGKFIRYLILTIFLVYFQK